MNIEDAFEEIQRMHEDRCVRKESIYAWYTYHKNKLPKLKPERSEVDLVRAIAYWMNQADRGNGPPFPYDYSTNIQLDQIDPESPPKARLMGCAPYIFLLCGLILLFFNWKYGIALLLGGLVLEILHYIYRGGSTNPELLKEGTTMYRNEGRKVFDWLYQRP